jgi:hypothetical protein
MRLIQLVALDEADAAGSVLPAKNGRVLAARKIAHDRGFAVVCRSEAAGVDFDALVLFPIVLGSNQGPELRSESSAPTSCPA